LRWEHWDPTKLRGAEIEPRILGEAAGGTPAKARRLQKGGRNCATEVDKAGTKLFLQGSAWGVNGQRALGGAGVGGVNWNRQRG